mmetsp:Transcript_11292/g.17883  ORF Transcript_11292/g.17883 Transcript_11292/m.17883 type:complete len:204 (-) Transcript_11292:201-812(-)|eukprot:CAMPEP_0201611058 /NCGR_PEP_ID=MMETSP0492-20130828/18871_1 /ASSEMBLY_ACC=CAM_ASM_000837 /TAXON_ID=420259 /ORGANISM="Thalassiosira gravida, Strain GMp14c1" /LENGTH=203 /DNA_ID=CAMNT_0048077087 /DNA_START=204 /DNA_END=815 /DNA_ORIENTATION=-
MVPQYLLVPLAILAVPASSFTTPSRSRLAKRFYATIVDNDIAVDIAAPLHYVSGSDLTSRDFQIEELEDREGCETELWLNEDGTVTIGATNGPSVKDYMGNWEFIETASESEQPFRMKLTRSYGAGYNSSSGDNCMGEFTYDITREFWGTLKMVGSSISISGKTHANTEFSSENYIESEVGFFSIIDRCSKEQRFGQAMMLSM